MDINETLLRGSVVKETYCPLYNKLLKVKLKIWYNCESEEKQRNTLDCETGSLEKKKVEGVNVKKAWWEEK
jgi:hypothetical protein